MHKRKIILVFLLFLSLFINSGFTNVSQKPKTIYKVYLKGKVLGNIESKESFEKYIDDKQEEIKKKYQVNKVYVPEDLDIIKQITFENDIKTNEEIYKKIKDTSPFTINGYVIKIKNIDSKDDNDKKSKYQNLYVIKKDIFTKSIEKTVKSFITPEEYDNYANDTQKEIQDTGKIIENIYIKNKITIKKDKIPIDKVIYQNIDELSKYLLFGTTDPQATYIIQDGDTISDVAFNNKISIEEFLIANPELQDENSLLSPGQVVTLGILKPQFSLVEEDHVVFREEKNFTTETRYDNDKLVGYEEVIQAGIKGENKVTQKVQKVNGEIVNTVSTSTEIIKEPVTEIIVKGGKQESYSSYYGNGYGSVVATRGQWGWPASCSTVSSGFGWRWGVLHDGTDIAGCGYGSNIFAAQSGTVAVSSSKADNGQYIVIDHHNGFYTMYAHLCVGCRYVKAGDYVEKGQVIGGMGQTGAATGVHLHFAIWNGYPYRGGVALNAMNFY